MAAFTYNGSNPDLRAALGAASGAAGSAARLVTGGMAPPSAAEQAALQAKFEREKNKHGKALEKAHAVKEKRKKEETVKSWMELFVLLQEKDRITKMQQQMYYQQQMMMMMQQQQGGVPAVNWQQMTPQQQQQMMLMMQQQQQQQQQQMMQQQQQQQMMQQQQIPQRYYPQGQQPVPQRYSPPQMQAVTPQQQQQQAMAAQSAIFQEKPPQRDARVAQPAFQNVPAPSTNNLAYIPASDRATYDAALDQQYKQEQLKLAQMVQANASPQEIQAQRDRLYQMEQQIQMASEQAEMRSKNKKKPQKDPKELSLPEALTEFFRVHEPEVLEDGRLEAVLEWAEERGVEKLCAMLREQYGADLFGKRNLEDNAVDQVQADRIARKLIGFYKAHGVTERTGWTEVIKVAEWAVKRGEAALNQKLNAKYGDDLDQYAQRVKLEVEPKLRGFLAEKDPATLAESGTTGMVGFAVANGVEQLNAQLLQRYGTDLNGARPPSVEEKRGKSLPDPRAILYREMSQSDALPPNPDDEDLLKQRKDQLIKQLASFLEAKDPKRLETGGLVPLVQWAIVRSDKQVDELLMEAYGDDLRQAGLRRLSFDEEEKTKWGGKLPDGPAGRYARAASVATDDEIGRAEVRSMRISTHEAVVNAPDSRRGSLVDRPTSGAAATAMPTIAAVVELDVPEPNF